MFNFFKKKTPIQILLQNRKDWIKQSVKYGSTIPLNFFITEIAKIDGQINDVDFILNEKDLGDLLKHRKWIVDKYINAIQNRDVSRLKTHLNIFDNLYHKIIQ